MVKRRRGLAASWAWDLPCGAAIAVAQGLSLVVAGGVRAALHDLQGG